MDENNKQSTIVELKTKITNLEHELQAAKRALFELGEAEPIETTESSAGKVIEGTFNGENMIDAEGKVFPVPANYASKSKLVEGDRLKLTIGTDGSFLFKQIGPAERRKAIGILKFENNSYVVEVDGSNYHVLYASVTYHKAKPGDNVAIVLPSNVQEPKWCALESVIHDIRAGLPIDNNNSATELNELEKKETSEPDISSLDASAISTAEPMPVVDPALDAVRDSLKIDDIQIVGKQDASAPEAVNPQDFGIDQNVAQSEPTAQTSSDGRLDAIKELEI